MNLGGIKVLPGWIESALVGIEGVTDLAVFALPEAARVGQWYVAGVGRDAVLAEIGRRLPPLPLATLLYVSQIPRNAMGEVERLRLAEIARMHGSGSAERFSPEVQSP